MRTHRRRALLLALVLPFLLLAGCGDDGGNDDDGDNGVSGDNDDGDNGVSGDNGDDDGAAEQSAEPGGTVTVYSGRSEELVGPLFDRFTEATGIDVEVRYGDTAEMAATILEEGANSPADLYFAQDAGALGALRDEGRLVELPEDLTDVVDARFRATDQTWVGTSGRARVLAYNTDRLSEAELPDSVLDLTAPEWEGRVGWAPTNGSFQAFVTAMRLELGDEATLEWLEAMRDNGAVPYDNNTAQVEAAGRGEIDVGLVNHYYLHRFLAEDPDFPVANHYLRQGDVGALVNIAGVGVLDSAEHDDEAQALVQYLLSDEAQSYVADEVFEMPLIDGVEGAEAVPAIDDIDTPDIDLSDLADLEGTLDLLRQAGVLP